MKQWAMTGAVLAGFLAAAGTLNATLIPDATFNLCAGEQPSFTPGTFPNVNVNVDTSVPQSVSYDATNSLYTVTASASTSGAPGLGGSPTANAQGGASGKISSADVAAAARITYFVGVDAIGGAPVRSVPVILHATGSISVGGNGLPSLVSRVTSGVWLGASKTQWCFVEFWQGDWASPKSYDKTTTIMVTSGSSYQVLVNAFGSGHDFGVGGSNNTGSWNFTSVADPTATIDPSYAYADQYLLTMSANAVVPEPATLSLLALGGVGLLVRRRRR